jgi:hypothetical protein
MAEEYLEIDGVDLSVDGAWRIKDHTPLKEPPAQRGDDRLIPGDSGRLAMLRRVDATTKRLDIWFFGINDVNGDPYTDQQAGLQANIDYIVDNVVMPTGVGDGTRFATWYLPDESSRSTYLHVLGLTLERRSPSHAIGTLLLSIPSGVFTPNGS